MERSPSTVPPCSSPGTSSPSTASHWEKVLSISTAAGASSAVAAVSGGALGGPTVQLTAAATDDTAVELVWVAVSDRCTGQRLQLDGVSFGGVYARVTAALDAPGTTSTGWTFPAIRADCAYVIRRSAGISKGDNGSTRAAIVRARAVCDHPV